MPGALSDESDGSLLRRSSDPSGAFYAGSMDGRTDVFSGVSLRAFEPGMKWRAGVYGVVESSESDAQSFPKAVAFAVRCSHFWPIRMEGWAVKRSLGVGVSARPRSRNEDGQR